MLSTTLCLANEVAFILIVLNTWPPIARHCESHYALQHCVISIWIKAHIAIEGNLYWQQDMVQ